MRFSAIPRFDRFSSDLIVVFGFLGMCEVLLYSLACLVCILECLLVCGGFWFGEEEGLACWCLRRVRHVVSLACVGWFCRVVVVVCVVLGLIAYVLCVCSVGIARDRGDQPESCSSHHFRGEESRYTVAEPVLVSKCFRGCLC